MKKRITYLSLMAAALFAVSCTNDEELNPPADAEGRVPVVFTTENLVNLETKASLPHYEGDVRIAMIDENGTLIKAKYYTVENDGTLGNVGEPLYYPTNGSNVKFHAYLSKSNDNAYENQYTANLEDNFSFVTAATEANYNEETGKNPVTLNFNHQFARITIEVKTTDFSANNVSATISDQPVSITYDITTNTVTPSTERKVINQCGSNGGQKFFLIYPEAFPESGKAVVNFTIKGDPTTFKATLSEPEGGFKAGTKYMYTVTLNKAKTEVTFEKPTMQDWSTADMGELTPEETTEEP